jgi:hypothetical protein
MRRHRRFPALRYAALRTNGDGLVPGSIIDLSVTGCRVSTQGVFANGTRVCLRIEKMNSVWGTVVWQHATDVGIKFEHPMHPAVVEHIARVTSR